MSRPLETAIPVYYGEQPKIAYMMKKVAESQELVGIVHNHMATWPDDFPGDCNALYVVGTAKSASGIPVPILGLVVLEGPEDMVKDLIQVAVLV